MIERAYIMWVLQSEGGNKSRAAEVLGIDPSTLVPKAVAVRRRGMMLAARPLPSLRMELLGNLAVLATAALALAVASVLVFTGIAESEYAALWLTLLIVADVDDLRRVRRLSRPPTVIRPVDEIVGGRRSDRGRRSGAPCSRHGVRRAGAAGDEPQPHDDAAARGTSARRPRREDGERRTTCGRRRARDRQPARCDQRVHTHRSPPHSRSWPRCRARCDRA